MNRRQFIMYGSSALIAAGGFSLVQSLGELQAPKREQAPVGTAGLAPDVVEILALAALAPSSHNTQPWTVTIVSDYHWMIGTDSSRWLPAVDPENREMVISIGAFLENLATAANGKGYEADIQIVAHSTAEQNIAAVKLQKTGRPVNQLICQIELRRTIRSNLLTQMLSSEDIQWITQGYHSDVLYYPSNSPQGKHLAESTITGNESLVVRQSVQEELAGWMRWSNQDSRQYGNGITAEMMELPVIPRWYAKNFYTTQSVLTQTFREASIQKVKQQVAAGGGWLVIASKDSAVAELIRVGRVLQRIWLRLRERSIALHPMTQAIEESAIGKALPTALGIDGDVQLVLRVGYVSRYPQPVSLRMPLQKIMLNMLQV